jgi:iron complex outermembrane receptor protein
LRVSNLGDEDQPKFAMRGMATPEFNLDAASPTGVFYDEVYIATQWLGVFDVFAITEEYDTAPADTAIATPNDERVGI